MKNLKMYNKPKARRKLCAMGVAGILLVGGLTGCGNKENIPKVIYGQDSNIETVTSKTFEAGEHIISVPIEDPTKDVMQHNFYPGYKCMGMGTASYGDFNTFAGACLLYVNDTAVECRSLNGKTFTDFGTPVDYVDIENTITQNGERTFGVGEHIISIPIPDPTNDNVQYQPYEGYEAIDIATACYGRLKGFSGAAILYVNTVPVKCVPTNERNGNYQYLTFGTPIEPEKVLNKIPQN
ncbi:MAG: hypothetical protein K2H20_00720 [Bacilli bacterium]|nr:hypothetical protein [Bacilli bacterium]